MKRERVDGDTGAVQKGSNVGRKLERVEDARMIGRAEPDRRSCEALPLALAGGGPRKARGLLLTRPNEGALLLMPCGDVHTVGMRHRLDIAFVDAAGVVLESYRSVGPFRRLRRKGAVAVVERFSSCASPWFSIGDRVGVVRVEGGRP